LQAFEAIYANAEQGGVIPWANGVPHPLLTTWAAMPPVRGRALVVGCGAGDDAEYLAGLGWQVTAFDVAPSAIKYCRERFPNSRVTYETADLFAAPEAWHNAFDLVLECRTLQALPWQLCQPAMEAIARFTAPRAVLLVLCLGREPEEDRRGIPWALARTELAHFTTQGLSEVRFEDFRDLPRRHFRITYQRSPAS
jgi:SAM-dependent methyltransferase